MTNNTQKIEIDTFEIKDGQIEIIWFMPNDEQSTITEMKLDEDNVLAAIEKTWGDFEEWVEVCREGNLFLEFSEYATSDQILPLLETHLQNN